MYGASSATVPVPGAVLRWLCSTTESSCFWVARCQSTGIQPSSWAKYVSWFFGDVLSVDVRCQAYFAVGNCRWNSVLFKNFRTHVNYFHISYDGSIVIVGHVLMRYTFYRKYSHAMCKHVTLQHCPSVWQQKVTPFAVAQSKGTFTAFISSLHWCLACLLSLTLIGIITEIVAEPVVNVSALCSGSTCHNGQLSPHQVCS